MRLNLTTPINSLGYGVVGLNILKALQKLGHDVNLHPIGNVDISSDLDSESVRKVIYGTGYNCPNLIIYHQWLCANYRKQGTNIGLSFWELDRLTEADEISLNKLDHLIVPSQWAALTVSIDCQVPVSVVPMGVDTKIFKPTTIKRINDDAAIFLNCGKWEVRKGHDILPELFNKAFTPKDNVLLWLLTNNPFCSPQEDQKWRSLYLNTQMGRAGKIQFIKRLQSTQDVANLMNLADYGIFPSRAEGWNLELLEMMACGKICIATNYSAHTEYVTRDNAYLIDIDETEPAYDGKWFFGQGNWAKIGEKQKEQCIEHMRTLASFDAYSLSAIETAKKLSWENTAKQIVEILK